LPGRAVRVSLRVRWTAALLSVALLPLAALSAVTLRIQRSGLLRAEQELELAVCDRVGDSLDRDLDYAGEATLRLGRVLTEGRIADDEGRLFVAREILARAAALQHVAVYTPAGDHVDTIARRDESREPAPPRRIPDEVQQRRPEFGEWAAPAFDANGVTLRFVVALLRDGQLRGWVVGTLSPRWIEDAVGSISRDRFGAPDRVLVVDRSLRLLSRGPGLAVGSSLAGREIFTRVHLTPESFSRPLQLTEDYLAEEPMVGSLRTLPERRWAVVVRQARAGGVPDAARVAAAGDRRGAGPRAARGAGGRVARGAHDAAHRGPRRAHPGLRGAALRGARRRCARATSSRPSASAMESMADSLWRASARWPASPGGARPVALPPRGGRAARWRSGPRVAERSAASRRTVTVLFADVVAFTAFAEKAPPEQVVAFLNELFTCSPRWCSGTGAWWTSSSATA
jgi:adenylate cyclase